MSERPLQPLDLACSIAARFTRAPMAFIVGHDNLALPVHGSFGLALQQLDSSWELPKSLLNGPAVVQIRNVAREPRLRDHPLVKNSSYVKSVIIVPITNESGKPIAGLTILDPDVTGSLRSVNAACLIDLGRLVSLIIEQGASSQPSGSQPLLLCEEMAIEPTAAEPTARFLDSTLSRRLAVRSRGDVTYTAVRTWNKQIKKHQLEALKALKATPNFEFVELISTEIAVVVRKALGRRTIDCVVPVPCGHSKGDWCLSSEIAESVARKLKSHKVEAFARQIRSGRSHPRKNAKLVPFELRERPEGFVVVVDDLASSGKHMEQAALVLREIADAVFCVVWIAD